MNGAARRFRTLDFWIGPVLSLAALALYLATASPWCYPGSPADFAVRHTGLAPYSVYTHGVWDWVAQGFLALPIPGTLVFRLSLLSALCGAAAVWIMFAIHRNAGVAGDAEGVAPDRAAATTRRLAGVTAATLLAVSVPFWFVANRPHPFVFDLLLLLTSVLFLQRFDRTRTWTYLYLASFLWGVGVVELPSFVIMTPFYALVMVISIFAPPIAGTDSRISGFLAALEELLKEPRSIFRYHLGRTLLAFFLGFSLFFVLAYRYSRSPSAEWAELDSYFAVVLQMARLHYGSIMGSVPRVGWLLIGMTCILPWAAMVALPKPHFTKREAILGGVLMHLVFTLLAVALAANVPFTPWRVLGEERWIIVPYVLLASWSGYLVGYWYKFFFGTPRYQGAQPPRRTWRIAYVVALVLALAAATVVNFSRADARRGAFVQQYAEVILEHLDGRSWVAGTGPLMNPMRIALHEQGGDAQVLDLALLSQPVYGAYLATRMEHPELHSMMEVGPVGLLKEWYRLDPRLPQFLAVIFYSDLLPYLGLDSLVREAYYVPSLGARPADIDQDFFARCRRVWERGDAILEPIDPIEGTFAEAMAKTIGMHLSKLANDVGVLVEDADLNVEAAEAYNQALAFNDDNLAALLNLHQLTERLESVQFPEVQARVERVLREENQERDIVTITQLYGTLRDPFAFRSLGLRLAGSGQGGRAIRELERARDLGARAGGVRGILGDLYLQHNRPEESRQEYEVILKNNPEHKTALMGMAYLEGLDGEVAAAEGYLERALKAGAEAVLVDLEKAFVRVLAGDAEKGAAMFRETVEKYPTSSDAAIIYARFLAGQGQLDQARDTLEQLGRELPSRPQLLVSLGTTYMMLGDLAKARNCLTRAANRFSHPMALARLIQLDLTVMDVDHASGLARRLLTQDPGNAWANFALGLDQYLREDTELAEASYRRALERERIPEALNSLAWLLMEEERYDEALSLAEECTREDPGFYSGWDTLGGIHLRQNRTAEARTALTRAAELAPEALAPAIHLLEVSVAEGDADGAAAEATRLLARSEEMSESQLELVEAISAGDELPSP